MQCRRISAGPPCIIILLHLIIAVDEAIRIAEKEHASNYTEIRKLDKKNKEVKDGRKKMIHQLVAEQKQINQNIHELEEVVTAVSNNTPSMYTQYFFSPCKL